MAFGDRPLARGDTGDDVVELQMRLAGFLGKQPDGDFGQGTYNQVFAFQRDFMAMAHPTGIADQATLHATTEFGQRYPIDFAQLKCRCGVCSGYGQGKYKDQYSQPGTLEKYYRYEYPGIHRMLLWAYRGAMLIAETRGWQLRVNSGYRCSVDNQQHNRDSTNHHGKAIDMDIIGPAAGDGARCNALRALLVERATAQIGWDTANRKSLEPADIAPTWVHYDVRNYAKQYLADKYFVKNAAALDAPLVV